MYPESEQVKPAIPNVALDLAEPARLVVTSMAVVINMTPIPAFSRARNSLDRLFSRLEEIWRDGIACQGRARMHQVAAIGQALDKAI